MGMKNLGSTEMPSSCEKKGCGIRALGWGSCIEEGLGGMSYMLQYSAS
jgi:hypothetical protein